jgi:PBSX family phage terminase large subunit
MALQIRFKIPPHKQQIIFMNSAKREQLFGGAKRGGKSVGIAQKIIALSMAFPGNRGLLARQNLTDLKDSTLVSFFQVCPPELIANHHLGDRKITFTNGSYFIYRGVGDEKELEKVKGIDLGWLAIDEPSEIEESTYLMLIAQLNWKLPDGTRPVYMALLACNPEPGWVKKRFIDLIEQGKLPDSREFIPSLAKDNPGLPPDYIDWLRANFPAEWVTKYVDGSWEISEGMVFKEFDKRIHVVDRLPPMAHLRHYGAMDHGAGGVTSLIEMGIDGNHNRFATREYYEKEKLVSQHAGQMIARLSEYRSNHWQYEYTLSDPAMAQRAQVEGKGLIAMRDLYAEYGLVTIPAWNLIANGIERLKEALHVVPTHVHPLTGKLGSPHLFISSSCVHTIDEFQSYKIEVLESGTVRYKGPDHALDPIRYIEVSRPRIPFIATGVDENAMGSTQLKAHRSHEAWKKRWDKQLRGAGQGDYFTPREA